MHCHLITDQITCLGDPVIEITSGQVANGYRYVFWASENLKNYKA